MVDRNKKKSEECLKKRENKTKSVRQDTKQIYTSPHKNLNDFSEANTD